MMQDSAYDIALTVPELLKYSKSLLGEKFPSKPNELKDSGYRNFKSDSFSLFANVWVHWSIHINRVMLTPMIEF